MYNDIASLFLPEPLHRMNFAEKVYENTQEKLDCQYTEKIINNGFSNTVIIYPPTLDWNWMKQRPQQLMEQFADHGFEVYYCNLKQQANINHVQIKSNLNLVYDNKKLISETLPLLKRRGKKILLWVSWSKLCIFLEQYRPDFVVYDYLDDFSAWAPFLDRMVKRADMVVATSQSLKRHIERNYPHKPNYLIPNGCDIQHFQRFRHVPPEKPAEYISHNGPVICYVGAWAPWVDQELVRRVACSFPNALIAIIGVELSAKLDKSIPNIKFLGLKPYEVLPQYLYYADVCLIPFKINEITLAANPIKMYEYLASGKPVVSTNLPEAGGIPCVYIGSDHQSFIKLIEINLSHSALFNQQEVNTWLLQHTWESRYNSIIQAVRANLIE